jgi:hypothetical protein
VLVRRLTATTRWGVQDAVRDRLNSNQPRLDAGQRR